MKRGGLADVIGSLPIALKGRGIDIRCVMPAHANIEERVANGDPDIEVLPNKLWIPFGDRTYEAGVFRAYLPKSVPVYFIAEESLLGRPEPYGYDDDTYRYAFFSRAIFELILALEWHPDILHAHDWHTAPAVFWSATAGKTDGRFRSIKSVYTIHNLMHQGKSPWSTVDDLKIITHGLNEESYGEVNFMARGIYHTDAITTVSPTYAQEITTAEGGYRLDGLLRHRGNAVSGILNGLDTDKWNPATDPRIPKNFSFETISEKIFVKTALQIRAGLPQHPDIPLIGMVTRLDYQKGLDITGELLHRLNNNWAGDAQIVILGSGAPHYEEMLRQMSDYHSQKMSATLAYDATLAPLIYAGADIFIMPSLFEPCGLSQMISMRYGTIPVVRHTGGLADTVKEPKTGFVFHDYTVDAFWNALSHAILTYRNNPTQWQKMQQNGMTADFSWDASAKKTHDLYNSLLQHKTHTT